MRIPPYIWRISVRGNEKNWAFIVIDLPLPIANLYTQKCILYLPKILQKLKEVNKQATQKHISGSAEVEKTTEVSQRVKMWM